MKPLSSILPRSHAVLKHVVIAAGYGPLFSQLRLEKNLESLGKERPGSTVQLMLSIEKVLCEQLLIDCGEHWASVLIDGWRREQGMSNAMRYITLQVDTTTLDEAEGNAAVCILFTVPALSEAFRRFAAEFPGIDEKLWWKSPLAAWVKLAAVEANLSEKAVLKRLGDDLGQGAALGKGKRGHVFDARTLERWMDGTVQPSLKAPYLKTVQYVINESCTSGSAVAYRLTGWLTVAIGYQSLVPEHRSRIAAEYFSARGETWTISGVVQALRKLKHDQRALSDLDSIAEFISQLPSILTVFGDDCEKRNDFLKSVRADLDQNDHPDKANRQIAHDWLTAWFAAISEDHIEAKGLFQSAVNRGRWCAGKHQETMTSDALLYAVGTGDKVTAKHYWDELCLLGVNGWPPAKPALDWSDTRRLEIAFEARFKPLKAKERVPPSVELKLLDESFSLTPDQLKNPNRISAFADGRTRRTPLMEAVDWGTPDHVRLLLDVGADVNTTIKESGENALIHAVRRCGEQRDGSREILDLLLDAKPSRETINREVSSSRETALSLAIDMADVGIVGWLIDLGALIDVRCDQSPCALVHALSLLSICDGGLDEMFRRWAGAEDGGDVYGARAGAATKADSAHERGASVAKMLLNERHTRIMEEVVRLKAPSVNAVRQVIYLLISYGADANARYSVPQDAANEWTPTLLAAQLGDIEVFRALVEGGGDPDLTLKPSMNPLSRHDALWVATAYGNDAVVRYLRTRD